jgi:hypothetical protein
MEETSSGSQDPSTVVAQVMKMNIDRKKSTGEGKEEGVESACHEKESCNTGSSSEG